MMTSGARYDLDCT